MEVYIATDTTDGHAIILGAWDVTTTTESKIEELLIAEGYEVDYVDVEIQLIQLGIFNR